MVLQSKEIAFKQNLDVMNQQNFPLGLLAKGLNYTIGRRVILKDFDLKLPSGQSCLILGPSGCGKTTLLSLLTGLLKPAAGEVTYDAISLGKLDENQRNQFRGQNIGVLFQNFHLIKSLTVRQNVQLTSLLSGRENDSNHENELLYRLGLKDKAKQKVTTLSTGEAQRLALARALAVKPKWLLCDEPTSSLDDNNTEAMLSLIKQEAKNSGISLVVVTHDNRVKQTMDFDQTITLGASA